MLDITPTFTNVPVLETERCILRKIVLDDVHDIFEVASDDSVTQYLPWETATTLEDAKNRIEHYMSAIEEQTILTWGIVNKSNNQLIGICLMFNFSLTHFRAEIGYALGSKWWRKGFMLEATSKVIDYAFNNMGFHSLEALIAPENVGSQRLLEKLGFIQEGYFRENYYDKDIDAFTDTAVFSLLKSTWYIQSNK